MPGKKGLMVGAALAFSGELAGCHDPCPNPPCQPSCQSIKVMTPRLSRAGGALAIQAPGLQPGDTPTVTLTQGTATKTLSLSPGDVQLGQINTSPASADLCSLSGGPVTVTVSGCPGSGQSTIYVPPSFLPVMDETPDPQATSLVWLGTQAGSPTTIFVLAQFLDPTNNQLERRMGAYAYNKKTMNLAVAPFGASGSLSSLPVQDLAVVTSTAVALYDYNAGIKQYSLRVCALTNGAYTSYPSSVLMEAPFLAGDSQGNLAALAANPNNSASISLFSLTSTAIKSATPATLPLPAKAPTTISLLDVGDLDGDKNSDIAVVGPGNSVSLFLQQTSGADSGTLMYDSTGSSSAQMSVQDSMALGTMTAAVLAVGDIDQDGLPDLVLVRASDSAVWWVPRQLEGTYAHAQALQVTLPGAPAIDNLVAIGDVNGDGAPDLVTGNSKSNILSVYVNQPAAGPSCQ